jgi:phosphate transport system substrate-binding protein
MKKTAVFTVIFLGALFLAAANAAADSVVKSDGSSTVYPITEAVAEEFQKAERGKIKVTVGISGTGGGFKKFCNGEIDIVNASRPIKKSEVELCGKNNIEYIELPVAYDGLAVVAHPENTWLAHLTVKELKKIWEPAAHGKVKKWSQIRENWPDSEIRLFGPGVDSGTFDYFTEAVVGKASASRGDYTASEDDNVLVQGVATDPLALGYFGVAYYEHNKDRLKLIAIDDENPANGRGPILPSYENIVNETYAPLSRPLFIYVAKKSAERKEIRKFVEYYVENSGELSREVGYIALSDKVYALALDRFRKRKTGTAFKGAEAGVAIEDILKRE